MGQLCGPWELGMPRQKISDGRSQEIWGTHRPGSCSEPAQRLLSACSAPAQRLPASKMTRLDLTTCSPTMQSVCRQATSANCASASLSIDVSTNGQPRQVKLLVLPAIALSHSWIDIPDAPSISKTATFSLFYYILLLVKAERPYVASITVPPPLGASLNPRPGATNPALALRWHFW